MNASVPLLAGPLSFLISEKFPLFYWSDVVVSLISWIATSRIFEWVFCSSVAAVFVCFVSAVVVALVDVIDCAMMFDVQSWVTARSSYDLMTWLHSNHVARLRFGSILNAIWRTCSGPPNEKKPVECNCREDLMDSGQFGPWSLPDILFTYVSWIVLVLKVLFKTFS